MKREVVIVDLGVIPYEYVKKNIENSMYEIIFIGQQWQIETLRQSGVNNQMIEYDTFLSPPSEHVSSDTVDYSHIFKKIVSDYQTWLIAERSSFRRGYRSNFNDIAKIDILIENYISFLNVKAVKFIFYQACPHSIFSWIFANVAEMLGIKVFMCNSTIFFWRNVLLEDLHDEVVVDMGSGDKEDPYVDGFIAKVTKSYDEAIPEYEKVRLKRRKGNYWSWSDELRACLKYLKNNVFLPLKYRLYKSYKKYSEYPNLEEKYIILFLHYQPERTSMPEGGYFSNQWHIINTIHRALPSGYKLYVKEHPSTFTNVDDYDPRYRNAVFYKNISSLTNVSLINSSVDTFSLVDKSVCVATITGTVGAESLLRGKPVLVFGNATYRDHKYVYPIHSDKDVEETLSVIRNVSVQDVKEYTKNVYIPMVIGKSMSGVAGNYDKGCAIYSEEIRNRSIARILCYLLEK